MATQHLLWRRIAAAGLALASAISLGACGSKDSSSSTASLPEPSYTVPKDSPAWKADKSKNNKLTWYVNADWWDKGWGKDMVTAQIKKDLNLDVNFVIGDDTKLNTYFASGDLPDIITVFDANSQTARTANKWAWPIKDLANKYDPYLNTVAQKDTLEWYKLADGKTYGYPDYSYTPADYKSGTMKTTTAFIMRQDVADAVSDADFTTPQGFIDGMKEIKQKFPDLVPFGFPEFTSSSNSSLDSALQDMLGVPITKGGKFYDRQQDKDYITWLKALRQVYADGNISDDSFADQESFKGKLSSGKYATVLINDFGHDGADLQTWDTANKGKEYIATDAFKSTEGRKHISLGSGLTGWGINYITTKSKNPAKATQLFEYLLSDRGQMLTNFGIEGKTYTKNADGTVQWTPEADKVRLNDTKKWATDYRIAEFTLLMDGSHASLNKDSVTPSILQFQKWGDDNVQIKPPYEIENIDPDTGTPESRSLSAIKTQWSTSLVSMIRSKSESQFNAELKKYQQFLKDNNIDGVNKVRNEKVAQNVKRVKNL